MEIYGTSTTSTHHSSEFNIEVIENNMRPMNATDHSYGPPLVVCQMTSLKRLSSPNY